MHAYPYVIHPHECAKIDPQKWRKTKQVKRCKITPEKECCVVDKSLRWSTMVVVSECNPLFDVKGEIFELLMLKGKAHTQVSQRRCVAQ